MISIFRAPLRAHIWNISITPNFELCMVYEKEHPHIELVAIFIFYCAWCFMNISVIKRHNVLVEKRSRNLASLQIQILQILKIGSILCLWPLPQKTNATCFEKSGITITDRYEPSLLRASIGNCHLGSLNLSYNWMKHSQTLILTCCMQKLFLSGPKFLDSKIRLPFLSKCYIRSNAWLV